MVPFRVPFLLTGANVAHPRPTVLRVYGHADVAAQAEIDALYANEGDEVRS